MTVQLLVAGNVLIYQAFVVNLKNVQDVDGVVLNFIQITSIVSEMICVFPRANHQASQMFNYRAGRT